MNLSPAAVSALRGQAWAVSPRRLQFLGELMGGTFAPLIAKLPPEAGADSTRCFDHRFHHLRRTPCTGPGEADSTRCFDHRFHGVRVYHHGNVAVVRLYGFIFAGLDPVFYAIGVAIDPHKFAAAHEELVSDPAVSAVVWDVDSPGGSVAGVPEAADRLYALRGKKPTVAVSNTVMASAAYWLASAADEVVATPSSLTGSIGVYTIHEDHSEANAKRGVKLTYVKAGRMKTVGNPDEPLTPEAHGSMQQMIDDFYGQFVAAVARHRKTTPAAVRAGFGEGDTLTANRAVTAKLADRVGTFQDALRRVISRVGGRGVTPSQATAGRPLWHAEQRHSAAQADSC